MASHCSNFNFQERLLNQNQYSLYYHMAAFGQSIFRCFMCYPKGIVTYRTTLNSMLCSMLQMAMQLMLQKILEDYLVSFSGIQKKNDDIRCYTPIIQSWILIYIMLYYLKMKIQVHYILCSTMHITAGPEQEGYVVSTVPHTCCSCPRKDTLLGWAVQNGSHTIAHDYTWITTVFSVM